MTAEVEVGSSENEKQDVGTVITERPSLLRARASCSPGRLRRCGGTKIFARTRWFPTTLYPAGPGFPASPNSPLLQFGVQASEKLVGRGRVSEPQCWGVGSRAARDALAPAPRGP